MYSIVSLPQLWLCILLSGVAVFIASMLIHMVLRWHASDYLGLPNEDEVRTAILRGNPAPGQYVLPFCPGMKDMEKPDMARRYMDGPVGFLTLRPSGVPDMRKALGLWFLYALGVAFMAAYLASNTLNAGSSYVRVFRVVGTVSFLTYAGGSISLGIWSGKPWRSVVKDLLDGLIYGLVSAGVFGWLWPR